MKRMKIAVINQSTDVSDTEVAAMTVACQKQISQDVAPAWSAYTAMVRFAKNPNTVGDDWFPVYLLDNADAADALGYHDLTPEGRPYARVFTKVSKANGASVSSVLSHEVIELFLDPDCNRWAIDFQDGVAYAVEGCDAVEGDSYLKGDIEVSNFIYPEWFNRQHPAGAKFDHLGKLTGPFLMTSGGYLIYMKGGSEQQKFGFILGDDVPDWKKEAKWFAAARTVRKLNLAQTVEGTGETPVLPEDLAADGDAVIDGITEEDIIQ